MRTYRKSDVTILFVCFNESSAIAGAIKVFLEAGFTNVVVVDDHSTDNTSVVAKKAGAKVIRNHSTLGFNYTLLKGLYLTRSNSVLIMTDPTSTINPTQLNNFVELGMLGEYPLLLPHGKAQYGINFSKALKKMYGIILPEPGFEGVFIHGTMLDIIRRRVTGNSPYVLFEVIKAAADERAKIGVYRSGIMENTYEPSDLRYRLRRRRRMNERHNYIREAFPDLARQQQSDQLAMGILIGAMGAALGVAMIAWAKWFAAYLLSRF